MTTIWISDSSPAKLACRAGTRLPPLLLPPCRQHINRLGYSSIFSLKVLLKNHTDSANISSTWKKSWPESRDISIANMICHLIYNFISPWSVQWDFDSPLFLQVSFCWRDIYCIASPNSDNTQDDGVDFFFTCFNLYLTLM